MNVDLGKDRGTRVDLTDDFDRLIRQKGYRAYWSRAVLCPCRLNSQTEQPDPACQVCGADGYFYVCPDDAPTVDLYTQETPPFGDLPDAKATQVLLQSITKDPQIFEKMAEWIFGGASVTSFSFMPIQFRDRLVMVDEVMNWQQTITVSESKTTPVGRGDPRSMLRYPIVNLLGVFTVDDVNGAIDHKANVSLTTNCGLDFTNPQAPNPGTRVTVVYQYNPILIITDHVHGVRASPTKFKTKKKLGSSLALPIQGMARLDFLVSPGTANGLGTTT